jgi:hypothetical protein
VRGGALVAFSASAIGMLLDLACSENNESRPLPGTAFSLRGLGLIKPERFYKAGVFNEAAAAHLGRPQLARPHQAVDRYARKAGQLHRGLDGDCERRSAVRLLARDVCLNGVHIGLASTARERCALKRRETLFAIYRSPDISDIR